MRTVEIRAVVVLDAAVPVLVGTVIVVAGVLGASGPIDPVALALGIAAGAVLTARRRAPGWTLVVSGALVQALFAIDATVGAIAVLSPAVALYSLALTRGRVERAVAAVAAVAAVVAADLLHAGRPGVIATVGHVALVAIPLLAAEALRTRRSYVAVLAERLALAERSREQEARARVQGERLRIARDLHDVVAHALTAINVQAATAGELLDRDPAHARGALALIEDTSRDAIVELRAMLGVLRDEDGDPAPRSPAPRVDDLTALVARAREAGDPIDLRVDGARPERLTDAVSLAAYRIVQESLTNARRHAPGGRVDVRLAFSDGSLEITVENARRDGSAVAGDAAPGLGIVGMAERAAAVGGSLTAEPLPTGFRVHARLPYAAGAS